MKRVSTLALALALATTGTGLAISAPAHAFQATEEAEEFSARNLTDAVRAAVGEAQTALEAEGEVDTAAVRGLLDTARAAIQNDDDRFIVGQMYLQLSGKMQDAGGDQDELARVQRDGLQLALDSNRVAIARRGLFWRTIGAMANRDQDYAAAITSYQNSLRYDPDEADAMMQLASALFRTEQSEAGFTSADNAISRLQSAGTEVPRSWLTTPLSHAFQTNNVERYIGYGIQLLEEHPNTQNWNEVLRTYQAIGRFDDQANLDVLRLMRASGALDAPSADEYARIAMRRGLPGEAQSVYSAAIASGEVEVDETLRAEIAADVRGDQADLSTSAAGARSAANGQIALNTGDAFASYGQYDSAIEMYRLALEKGGVDAGTVNLHIAVALANANRVDEAAAAFDAVTGPRAGTARFWKTWIAQQSTNAAPGESAESGSDDSAEVDDESAE